MPARTLTPTPRTYAELRRAVETAMIRGQREADLARVRTYHETGRLIHEHVLLFKDRANYGGQVIPRLARDLHVSDRSLYHCLQFFRTFPILHGRAEFTWAHYRALMQVADKGQRRTLELEAARQGWTSTRLEERIRPINALAAPPGVGDPPAGVAAPKPLTPKRGTVGVWRIVASDDGRAVDLGFTAYVDLPPETKLREDAFVQLGADGVFTVAPGATKTDLYTYTARILRVVDGDTLWVKIHLRPDLWVKEKLRLRGLDCPEMNTPEGRAAKRFVEGLVAAAQSVTITTFKPDKYDRYLADVFLDGEGGAPAFLNNELLKNGHAGRKDEYALTDWDGSA